MKNIPRYISLIIFATLAFSIIGCGGSSDKPDPDPIPDVRLISNGDTFTYNNRFNKLEVASTNDPLFKAILVDETFTNKSSSNIFGYIQNTKTGELFYATLTDNGSTYNIEKSFIAFPTEAKVGYRRTYTNVEYYDFTFDSLTISITNTTNFVVNGKTINAFKVEYNWVTDDTSKIQTRFFAPSLGWYIRYEDTNSTLTSYQIK